MNLKVIEYEWNGKGCYLGVIAYEDISKIIKLEVNQAKNRNIDPSKVEQIITYIMQEGKRAFFPPVILNSSSKFTLNDNELTVRNNSLVIIDGQHRLEAISRIVKENIIGEDVRKKEIPFLLIESVENQEHRELFKLIVTVQSPT